MDLDIEIREIEKKNSPGYARGRPIGSTENH